MAAIFPETTTQYERDIRGANQEWKRGKDATVKWSYGSTVSQPWWSSQDPESENFKARPLGKLSDR